MGKGEDALRRHSRGRGEELYSASASWTNWRTWSSWARTCSLQPRSVKILASAVLVRVAGKAVRRLTRSVLRRCAKALLTRRKSQGSSRVGQGKTVKGTRVNTVESTAGTGVKAWRETSNWGVIVA